MLYNIFCLSMSPLSILTIFIVHQEIIKKQDSIEKVSNGLQQLIFVLFFRNKKEYISTKKSMEADGLSSLQYTEVATVLHPLFTHIMVDL